MRDYQRKHTVKRLPSLLEFIGYAFFFPSFLAGPTMEMSDYLAFIGGSMFKDCPESSPPSSLVPTLKTLGKALLCLPGPILGNIYFPVDNFLTQPFLESPIYVKYASFYQDVGLCVFISMLADALRYGSLYS